MDGREDTQKRQELQPPESRADFRVHGRVQGVGFRWWALRRAGELALRGTVRNCADGSVEVRAAGARDALETLASELRVGPAHARVDEVRPIPPKGTLPSDFRVLH